MGKNKKGSGGGGGGGKNANKKKDTGKKQQHKSNQSNKQKQQEKHVDPFADAAAAVESAGEQKSQPQDQKKQNKKQQQQQTKSKEDQEQKQQSQQQGGGGRRAGRGNKKNRNAAKDRMQGGPQGDTEVVQIGEYVYTQDELKKYPPRKKGETKKQWYMRIGLMTPEEGFLAHLPTGGAHRLDVNAADYDEEEPEQEEETNDDFSDTQNERAREYKKGGYHPVSVNEIYNERYRVVHKLGWGYFSTVWLVWDYKNKCFQAMKVQKSAQHYTEAAQDEIKLLGQIMDADPDGRRCCARMTDSFMHKGPHGNHMCMLFDLLGENLLSLGERYENRGIPLPIVKSIARETLIGLHHIHSIGIIHTDIKPENVLLSSPKHKIHSMMKKYTAPPMHERPSLIERDIKNMTKSQKRRYYQKIKQQKAKEAASAAAGQDPDVENGAADTKQSAAEKKSPKKKKDEDADSDATASDLDEADKKKKEDDDDAGSETDQEWEVERFHHVSLADFGNSCWIDLQFTDEVQTRQYRAPEVIIGDPYSCPIDLWSAACMFFELLTGEFLFDPKSSGDYPRDEDHLALISELMGDLPDHMAMGKGKYRSQFYNSRGGLRHINDLRYWSLKNVLHDKYRYTKKKAAEIAAFLEPMLELDPEQRATAEDMLIHFEEWFEVLEDDYSPLCFVSGNGGDDEEGEEFDPSHLDGGGDDYDDDDDADVEDEDGGGRRRLRRTDDDEVDNMEWAQQHPCLHPDSLAEVGLTLDDVQEFIQAGSLQDEDKDRAAQGVLEELMAGNPQGAEEEEEAEVDTD